MRRALFLFILPFIAATAAAQPYGIDTRAANTTLLIDDLPADTPGTMTPERVYPGLSFTQPTYMCEAPDGSGRFFVLEKTGRIRVFNKNLANPTAADVTTFLDFSAKVATSSEQGLLGMAFDPDYATNGVFYIYYSWNGTSPGTSRVSRLVASPPSGNTANPASEQIILAVAQPYANHNGGMIEFGPDGMLYIGFGDGGSGGDPGNRAQDTTVLLGKFLRIDVRSAPDPGLAYAIPSDNPFYLGGPAGTATRKEIYAYGLRNPWRFSFDRQTGRLWTGDVGQNQYEEIDVIEAGKNYGWRIAEGFHCYNPATCDMTGLTPPIVEYDHALGSSVTGGYVYLGTRLPQLHGMYLYSDYGSGRVWGLRYDGATLEGPFVLVGPNSLAFASFCQDLAGEVYLQDIGGGGIYRLAPATPPTGAGFPTRLSEIPALLAAGMGQDQTAAGIIPYAPSAQLWSDGTLKSRFIAMPGLAQATWRLAGGWGFPEKSVLVKNFLLPTDERDPQGTARRIETRILYRRNGDWHGFSYEWNAAGTDAELLVEGKDKPFTITGRNGQPVSFDYHFPSRSQCNACHTAAAGGVLGLNTPQMNAPFEYPQSGVVDNQLRTLDHIGLFGEPLPALPAQLPAMPDPFDAAAPLNGRARAYLAANCVQCHQPGATAPTSLDLRWEVANGEMNAIDVIPGNGDLGIDGARIVKPLDPARSVLLQRMNRRDHLFQMPPLATDRVDEGGVALIEEWISSGVFGMSAVRGSDWMMFE